MMMACPADPCAVDDPMPGVTVVIPTRNRRTLLMTTLAGVLAQTDVELEVVVVDEGSTDGTADAVAALGDARVRLLRNATAQGVVAARNRGLSAARGTWVAFCDDDDLWAPGKLASQIRAAERAGRQWAVAAAVGFEPDGTVRYRTIPPPDGELASLLPWWNTVPGGSSNVVARRGLIEQAGGFDGRFRVLADWDLWIRLVRSGGPPAVVETALVGYRMHGANMSTASDGVLEELRLIETLSADLRGGRPLDRAWFYRWMASSLLRGGHRRAAAAAFWRAASWRDPSPLVRSVASLTVPPSVWAVARRLRRARLRKARPGIETPLWLLTLLGTEQTSSSALATQRRVRPRRSDE
jgi:glycosyltransferase involved in cell wall biosynthesis